MSYATRADTKKELADGKAELALYDKGERAWCAAFPGSSYYGKSYRDALVAGIKYAERLLTYQK